jgi:hypothetical protein
MRRRGRQAHRVRRPRSQGGYAAGGEGSRPRALRIISGPDYTRPDQLERLRQRGVGRERGLAFRERALGIEALERFVRREPLYRVHEAVFAIHALESEPVDPRL